MAILWLHIDGENPVSPRKTVIIAIRTAIRSFDPTFKGPWHFKKFSNIVGTDDLLVWRSFVGIVIKQIDDQLGVPTGLDEAGFDAFREKQLKELLTELQNRIAGIAIGAAA